VSRPVLPSEAWIRANYPPIPYPDPPLSDGEIVLEPFTKSHVSWFLEVCERFPEIAETAVFPTKRPGRGEMFTFAQTLVALWGPPIGAGATFVVTTPEPIGLVWAVHEDFGSDRVALGGFRLPDPPSPPGQAARGIRLVAGWVRDSMGRESYVAVPCGNAGYIKWAEESGLPWDTRFPGEA
jgi:hypothetical protein